MTYVLDTNTISFLMRGDPPVTRQLLARPRSDVLLAQPAIAEIEYGLSRMPRSARRTRLRETADLLLAELGRAVWTDHVSRVFGEIKANLEQRGVRIEDLDVAVAAHARAIGATLVTDNAAHMTRIRDLRIENWRLE